MKVLSVVVFLMLVLSGCKSTQTSSRRFMPEPEWVTKTPTSPFYYIGIFGVKKTTPDFRNAAKRGALDNLSSEISVEISGESVLHSLEKNGNFDQEFQQSIKVISKEDIEGYELMDTWESATEYWVYYQLSRAEHKRIKQEKQNAAVSKAKDFFTRGKQKHLTSDYKQAFVLIVQGLESVSHYFDTPLKTTYEGKEVYLATEMLSYLQSMVDEIKISSPNKNLTVKLGDEVNGDQLYVNLIGKNGKGLAGIPVISEYKALFLKKIRISSDENGKAKLSIGKINQSQRDQTLITKIDFKKMAEEATRDRIVLALLKYMPSKEFQSSLTVLPPKVFVVPEEKEQGRKVRSRLKTSVTQTLIAKGFEVTSNKSDADLILYIKSDTQRSPAARGAVSVVVSGSIEVYEAGNNRLVFSQPIKQEKGLQMDVYRATNDAYSKAELFVKRRLIPKLANKYFSF